MFLLSAVMAVVLSGCNQGEFSGNRVKNPDAYLLDIRLMNGNDVHSMNLNQSPTGQAPGFGGEPNPD